MFVTAEEIEEYLEDFCDNIECQFRLQSSCPSSCPVAQARQAAIQMLDETPFDTERIVRLEDGI